MLLITLQKVINSEYQIVYSGISPIWWYTRLAYSPSILFFKNVFDKNHFWNKTLFRYSTNFSDCQTEPYSIDMQ